MSKKSSLEKLIEKFQEAGYPIWRGAEMPKRSALTTHSAKVDAILGGGLVPGSIVVVGGPHASGKSSLIASWLRDREALWVALEYTDPTWIKRLGGDPVYIDPQSGESAKRRFLGDDAWEAVRAAAQADVPLIVLDSLGALLPNSEDDKEMDEDTRAAVARLIAKGLRRTLPHLRKSILVLVAQVMDVQGSMFPMLRTKGGHAKDHYAQAILDVRRKDVIYRQEAGVKKAVGQVVMVRTVKNKWAAPYQECLIYLDYKGAITDDVPGRSEPKSAIEKMDERVDEG